MQILDPRLRFTGAMQRVNTGSSTAILVALVSDPLSIRMPICPDAHLAAYLRAVIWIRHPRTTRYFQDTDVRRNAL
jgi:hypothetical protein